MDEQTLQALVKHQKEAAQRAKLNAEEQAKWNIEEMTDEY